MKKRTVVYIASAVAILLVAVCCVFVFKYASENGFFGKTSESVLIYECIPGDIKKVSVENSTGKYSIIKEENWVIDELRGKELVEDSIISNVNALSRISGKKLEKETVDAEFDSRVIVSTVKDDFLFELAHSNENYYLKTEKGHIYTVSPIWYTVAERNMNYYRDSGLSDIKSLTEGGENRFVSYSYKPSIKQENLSEIVVRVKNSTEIQYFDTSSPYMMERPYVRNVDKDVFESKVLSNIPNIRVDKFIEEDCGDFEPYGLDKESRGELTLRYDNKTFRLFIGDNAGSGTVYAALDGKNDVYTIMKAWIEFTDSESFEFIDKSLYTYNADYVTKAEAVVGGKKLVIRTLGEKFYIDDKPVAPETFNGFKDEVKKLKITSLCDAPSGEEILRLKIYGRDYKTARFSFLKTEDGRYIVSENDKLYYYISEEQIKNFEKYFNELQKALI